jgi:hypothetical protein
MEDKQDNGHEVDSQKISFATAIINLVAAIIHLLN